jgi:hypothetical protein
VVGFYLEDRLNHITCSGSSASFATPGVGVPQGSVLGPFLFNMYVNDLANALVSCDLIQYADDTALVVKVGRNIHEFNEVAERAVESALGCFSVNRLDINVRKTTFVMFGRQAPLINVLKVGNQIIPRSDNTVYLGLRLDGRLTWTNHINYVVSRIRHINC